MGHHDTHRKREVLTTVLASNENLCSSGGFTRGCFLLVVFEKILSKTRVSFFLKTASRRNLIHRQMTVGILESFDLSLKNYVDIELVGFNYIKKKKEKTTIKSCSKTSNIPQMQYSPIFSMKDIEKLRFVCKNFGDIRVHLANKSINLWKSFLLSSGIKKNLGTVNELKDPFLTHLSLNVEEEKVLMFFCGIETKIKADNLVDYFLLFKGLGLTSFMDNIITKLSSEDLSFEKLHDIFVYVRKHESDVVSDWYSSNVKIRTIDESTFAHSFSLALFNEMKKKIEVLKRKPQLYLSHSNIIAQLNSSSKNLLLSNHSDFKGKNLKNLPSPKDILRTLLVKKEYHNVILRSSDGKEIPAHWEILVSRSTFFRKCYEFQGLEIEEVKKTGVMSIQDLDTLSLQVFLEYLYTGEITTKSLESAIVVLVFGKKYIEEKMVEVFLTYLEKVYPVLKDFKPVKDVLKRTFHLFFPDKELLSKLLPIFRRLSGNTETVESIEKFLRRKY